MFYYTFDRPDTVHDKSLTQYSKDLLGAIDDHNNQNEHGIEQIQYVSTQVAAVCKIWKIEILLYILNTVVLILDFQKSLKVFEL